MSQTTSFHAEALQTLMQRANISSQRALAAKANVSRWQVQQLRQGKITAMRVDILKQLAAALDCSLTELLATFSTDTPAAHNTADEVKQLRQEYGRLQQQFERQNQTLQQQFESKALTLIESWLTYWPTAAKAALEQEGFDAKKLLPLVKPIERLVASWDVTIIGTVGEQLAYDPQQHQLTKGIANPGDLIRISHVGYRHHGKLLQRAKGVPINR